MRSLQDDHNRDSRARADVVASLREDSSIRQSSGGKKKSRGQIGPKTINQVRGQGEAP